MYINFYSDTLRTLALKVLYLTSLLAGLARVQYLTLRYLTYLKYTSYFTQCRQATANSRINVGSSTLE